ncbi:MAG: hypothetical protein KDB48_04460, partial [Solirubrobacterales bacterium]|nr:hypothetical protein [Solirubrobacterales bacterium]
YEPPMFKFDLRVEIEQFAPHAEILPQVVAPSAVHSANRLRCPVAELDEGGTEAPGEAESFRLQIVSPVYRDVEPFLRLRAEIREAVASSPEVNPAGLRFTVLDDTAGQDPEIESLRELDDVEVVEPPFSLGHQRGLVYALRHVLPRLQDEDVLVTLDSDGEDKPADVPRVVAGLLEVSRDTPQIVIAKRTKRSHAPLAFRILYPAFKGCFKLATGSAVESGNFAAYRAGTARRILLHPSFALCYSSTLLVLKVPVTFVPCERGPRFSGSSRMGYSQLFTHAMRMLMPFSEAIARRALWLFLSIFLLAVGLAVVILAVRYGTSQAIPGWATYSLAAMGILSMVSLGNLCILFTLYSQSVAVSLRDLEAGWAGQPGQRPE